MPCEICLNPFIHGAAMPMAVPIWVRRTRSFWGKNQPESSGLLGVVGGPRRIALLDSGNHAPVLPNLNLAALGQLFGFLQRV